MELVPLNPPQEVVPSQEIVPSQESILTITQQPSVNFEAQQLLRNQEVDQPTPIHRRTAKECCFDCYSELSYQLCRHFCCSFCYEVQEQSNEIALTPISSAQEALVKLNLSQQLKEITEDQLLTNTEALMANNNVIASIVNALIYLKSPNNRLNLSANDHMELQNTVSFILGMLVAGMPFYEWGTNTKAILKTLKFGYSPLDIPQVIEEIIQVAIVIEALKNKISP